MLFKQTFIILKSSFSHICYWCKDLQSRLSFFLVGCPKYTALAISALLRSLHLHSAGLQATWLCSQSPLWGKLYIDMFLTNPYLHISLMLFDYRNYFGQYLYRRYYFVSWNFGLNCHQWDVGCQRAVGVGVKVCQESMHEFVRMGWPAACIYPALKGLGARALARHAILLPRLIGTLSPFLCGLSLRPSRHVTWKPLRHNPTSP